LLSYPISARTPLVGLHEGHPACKKTGCWFVGGDNLNGALHVLQLQLSQLTSIILSSSKIQNGDSLLSANLDPSGKWPLKQRERMFAFSQTLNDAFRRPLQIMPVSMNASQIETFLGITGACLLHGTDALPVTQLTLS